MRYGYGTERLNEGVGRGGWPEMRSCSPPAGLLYEETGARKQIKRAVSFPRGSCLRVLPLRPPDVLRPAEVVQGPHCCCSEEGLYFAGTTVDCCPGAQE